MRTDFPDAPRGEFLNPKDFEIPQTLTYVGWEQVANEDFTDKNGNKISWKDRLKYVLRYSYPEWAKDEAGEQINDKSGKPIRNRYYESQFPHGWFAKIIFQEGELSSAPKPLFEALCRVKPNAGDRLTIQRTGSKFDTKWSVERVINIDKPQTRQPDVLDRLVEEPF